MKKYAALLLVSFIYLFSSCEKVEQPVRLPERGTAIHAAPVNMGEDYLDQIFFNLNSNQVVYTSLINSWDLAFETTPDGYHIFINTAIYKAYNTGQKDITQVLIAPKYSDPVWKIDASNGLLDSTVIGEWKDKNGNSKNDVYVLLRDTSARNPTYARIQVLSVSSDSYTILFGDIGGKTTTATIKKNPECNRSYYSFIEGEVFPEPAKSTWDIVFTRYSTFVYNSGTKAYQIYAVVGALLNPYKTTGAFVDSTSDFSTTDIKVLDKVQLKNYRDIIGYTWKTYDFNISRYSVNPNKVYIINDKNNYYWKLHFLDYYSPEGKKGSPSFEYERLQ